MPSVWTKINSYNDACICCHSVTSQLFPLLSRNHVTQCLLTSWSHSIFWKSLEVVWIVVPSNDNRWYHTPQVRAYLKSKIARRQLKKPEVFANCVLHIWPVSAAPLFLVYSLRLCFELKNIVFGKKFVNNNYSKSVSKIGVARLQNIV